MTRRPKRPAVKKPRKRIASVSGEKPVAEAAAVILRQRFDGVLYYLPRVAEHADENIEYVHQLRVASRRSVAAIDAYRPLLPRKRSKAIRKALRQLRKGLGEARDLDVMRMRLQAEAERTDSKKLRRVVRMLKEKRVVEQQVVKEACDDFETLKLPAQIDKLLTKTRWRNKSAEPTLLEFDADLFDAATQHFFTNIHPESKDPLVLHETRIEAKRLRYTLELVEPILPKAAARKPRRLFADLQESLGQISDHAAAEELFERWADKSSAGSTLKKLAATERKQLQEAAVAFHAHWPAKRLKKLRQLLNDLVAAVQTAAK